jgi:branched-chain amino acid transport system substrate-binding protein
MQGWMAAMLMTKAADEAIAQRKPFNGEGLRDALRAVRNWDTGGIIGAPVSFANNSIPLAQVVRFDAARDFVPTPISGWLNVDR